MRLGGLPAAVLLLAPVALAGTSASELNVLAAGAGLASAPVIFTGADVRFPE